MSANPLLKKLGFSDDDRVIIIHTDDIGMCQASLQAYMDLVDIGIISAASVMVPCPWFPATAAFCREHADKVDMGVHLTLTSEWDGYRWGPLSTRDPASGLIDEEGYFYRQTEPAQIHANAEAVKREMQAQIKQAVEAGIDVTHIDSHMGTVFHPKFLGDYVELALQHRAPPLLLRQDSAGMQALGIPPKIATALAQHLEALEAQGLPLLDHLHQMSLEGSGEGRLEQVARALAALPPGLSYFIIHPSKDSPELRAITPDWRCRVADYRTFTDEAMHRVLKRLGIHVIGYRLLRDQMRGSTEL